MCRHVGFLRSARAILEVVFRYIRRQINRRITLPYLLLWPVQTARDERADRRETAQGSGPRSYRNDRAIRRLMNIHEQFLFSVFPKGCFICCVTTE
jgi:hypothetical protein